MCSATLGVGLPEQLIWSPTALPLVFLVWDPIKNLELEGFHRPVEFFS